MMIMKMDEGLDTGPVALAGKVAIGQDTTAGELHDRLMTIGADLMAAAMSALEKGELTLRPQAVEGVTYARKIDKAETRIDWTLSSREVHNHIRGLSPVPGAWCEMEMAGGAERLKVLRSTLAAGGGRPGEILDEGLAVACGDGAVRLIKLQRAGGKPEFVRGAKTRTGMKLA